MIKDYKKLYESLKKEYSRLKQENEDLKQQVLFHQNEAVINKMLKTKTDNVMIQKLTELNEQNQKLAIEINEVKSRLRKHEKVD